MYAGSSFCLEGRLLLPQANNTTERRFTQHQENYVTLWFYYSLFTKCTSSLNLIDNESTLLISYFVNKPTYTGYRYFIINKNDEQKKNIEQQLYKDTENSFATKNLHLKL